MMYEIDDTESVGQRRSHRLNGLKAYAAVVHGTSVRMRVYNTLAGAENAVARAKERGQAAEITLVRLMPVPSWRLR